ncbi:MAG TPA: adenylyl-sulfate kinase [Pirellulales bacterium]|jgi:adenylylsulfate kinase|nr:adenylyl-sulfate kinase [Pirellulales bacterium]
MSDPYVVWHEHGATRLQREQLAGHRGCVVWFTGLSGSGKSTVANLVDQQLLERKVRSFVLDGDNLRHGLCATPQMLESGYGGELAKRFGLGFSALDRQENIRRVGAVARLFAEAGVITLTAFVSPYRRDRDAVRASLPADDFIEVFVDTPLSVCERRDPKGLYAKARAGTLKGMTGIDDPYEPPTAAELVLAGGEKSAQALASEVLGFLQKRGKIPAC